MPVGELVPKAIVPTINDICCSRTNFPVVAPQSIDALIVYLEVLEVCSKALELSISQWSSSPGRGTDQVTSVL